MEARYKWALSPSKFEASKGCACFEENPYVSEADKDRGTNLHSYMENIDAPLTDLDKAEAEAVQFCRDFDTQLQTEYKFKELHRELRIKKTNRSPGGLLDLCGLTEDGILIILDWKFGVQPVPDAQDNMQLCAYALMAYGHFIDKDEAVNQIMAGIVQPAQQLIDMTEFEVSDLERIESELKAANDRVTDPFKQPDPSDASKCQRCRHLNRCPAITGAVTTFVERAQLLPTPENFAPDAIVSERDRVIAQELAMIFETWADRVKKSNREYAIENGGTLAGIYNITTRSNGYEIADIPTFAQALVDEGVMESPEDLLNFVKVTKTKLIDGLSQLGNNGPEVKTIVSELEEKFGAPKPPVIVFRKGGKRQIAQAVETLGVPMLDNPFK
jgi:hypothetical protein